MSIFDIFTAKPAPATTPAANPTPVPSTGTGKVTDVKPTVETKAGPGTAPNGTVPDNVESPKSPLDEFATLWETDPNKKSPADTYKPEPLDTTKLQEMMGKIDLSSAVPADVQQAIAAGGEGAVEATMKALNMVAQQALVQSTLVANKMQEQTTVKIQEAILARIPSLLKEQNLSASLNDANPVYNNPAVAPIMDALKSTLAVKYPDASTKELTEMTQRFVTSLGQAVIPKEEPKKVDGDMDWSDWEKTM